MSHTFDVLVVGAGIFGVTAALSLQTRGYQVALLDPGPLPHPLAASTDISKVIRMEYGPDETYMEMAEKAREGWLAWNEQFDTPLYHETGVTMLTRSPMSPGGFEYESYHMLLRRGHTPERLNADEIIRRFPAWKPGAFVDGFYHAKGGFAESGRVISALVKMAETSGVRLFAGETVEELREENGRITGLLTRTGNQFSAAHTILAAGAWTWVILPELTPVMRTTGHPVFHLKPTRPELFTPPHFVVFTADISHSGWYGFPHHPREGVVKIANHGVGVRLHPEHDERIVTAEDEHQLRTFLADTFPALIDAPIVYTRRCLYCDSLDEHFWITQHPYKQGLTIATAGSGHGFKFGPVLGDLIADAVEGHSNSWLPKFAWRHLEADTTGEEASRFHGAHD